MNLVPRVLAIAAGAALAVGVLAPPAGAEVHECKDANGIVVYTVDPCVVAQGRPNARRMPVPVSAPAPAPAPARNAVSAPRRGRMTAALQRLLAEKPVSRPKVEVRSTDPKFGSPERTWRTFVAAVRSGDRAGAASCMTSSALEAYGPLAESIPLATLLDTVNSIARVASHGEVGPFWALRGERKNAPPKWVFLEVTEQGYWKIAAI